MFQSARLKLTAWYMLILASILLTFSLLIYQIGAVQLERSYHQAQMRLKASELGLGVPRNLPKELAEFSWEQQPESLQAEFALSKRALAQSLLLLNLGILTISSFLSYFLAGKTLRPIESMVLDQASFVADAAHELRTPITAMRTSLEVNLRAKNLKKTEALAALSDNLADVKDLENLSNQLLMLAAYQEGQTKLILNQINLKNLAKKIERKFKGRLESKKINLKVDVAKEAVFFDEAKIEQLLTILIDNAISYSAAKKTIWLKMKIDKKCFRIEVKDQGMGISQFDQQKLFNRFYRSDQARTHRHDEKNGFGLGLSIAKKIVELHRGKIEVKSQEKQGTSFLIRLPL